MKLKTLIVEDDLVAQMLLEFYSGNIPEIELTKKFDSVSTSIKYLKTHQPDLIFLDIELKDGKGWELLDAIGPKTTVVVTTKDPTYAETAADKYAINHVLVKPISLSSFLQLIKKVLKEKENY